MHNLNNIHTQTHIHVYIIIPLPAPNLSVCLSPSVCSSSHIPPWWLARFSSYLVLWVANAWTVEFGYVSNLSNYVKNFINFSVYCDSSEKNVVILFIFGTVKSNQIKSNQISFIQPYIIHICDTLVSMK